MHRRDRKNGKIRKLSEMRNGTLDPGVWSILRFIVATNTSYLREIEDPRHQVQGVPKAYKQFEFLSGAPQKEAKMRDALLKVQANDANALKYPSLYAFHGSSVR
jgi:ubiquitin-conjugating enzyme E2 Q